MSFFNRRTSKMISPSSIYKASLNTIQWSSVTSHAEAKGSVQKYNNRTCLQSMSVHCTAADWTL